ncbi:uncharacterized protein RAG0_00484 [Rhynchosporium agropyri]|uniref:Uncharacterized protein n=1 Tax=Rhynchosporium agropyri TaxID=914238 RepID=A0A1E1JTH3_9HELO|nr:uncharacterized protein RAG0_00484 [Rhynchosporium agropyri]
MTAAKPKYPACKGLSSAWNNLTLAAFTAFSLHCSMMYVGAGELPGMWKDEALSTDEYNERCIPSRDRATALQYYN